MIYIASDHGGYKLKEDLKKFLSKKKIALTDLGPEKLDPNDDYPIYAKKVAEAVAKDLQNNKGILICRSGQGVCIVANKVKGIRAALAWNEVVAKHSRRDDDANILCLPSDYVSTEVAEDATLLWLKTEFSTEEKYARRLKEID
ncbi:MAG: hypothetical protein NVSMB66_0710 [Candidatus Doudnabacteria bacterium]